MGKPISRTVRGIGKAVGSLFGGGDASIPKAPELPAPPPQIPMPVVRPDTVIAAKESISDPRRVSRRRTIKTSARGVTTQAPIRYATLLGGSTSNN